jgi:hypothetical protein
VKLREYLGWLEGLSEDDKIKAMVNGSPHYPERAEDLLLWKAIYVKVFSFAMNDTVDRVLWDVDVHPAGVMERLGKNDYPTNFTRNWAKHDEVIAQTLFGRYALDPETNLLAPELTPWWTRIGTEQNNRIRKRFTHKGRAESHSKAKKAAEAALEGQLFLVYSVRVLRSDRTELNGQAQMKIATINKVLRAFKRLDTVAVWSPESRKWLQAETEGIMTVLKGAGMKVPTLPKRTIGGMLTASESQGS